MCYRLWVQGRCADQECVPADNVDERANAAARQFRLIRQAKRDELTWVAEISGLPAAPRTSYLQFVSDGSALTGSIRIPLEELWELLTSRGHMGPSDPGEHVERPRPLTHTEDIGPRLLAGLATLSGLVAQQMVDTKAQRQQSRSRLVRTTVVLLCLAGATAALAWAGLALR